MHFDKHGQWNRVMRTVKLTMRKYERPLKKIFGKGDICFKKFQGLRMLRWSEKHMKLNEISRKIWKADTSAKKYHITMINRAESQGVGLDCIQSEGWVMCSHWVQRMSQVSSPDRWFQYNQHMSCALQMTVMSYCL